MAAHDDLGSLAGQLPYRGRQPLDAGQVGNLAVAHRHIEIGAHQDALAADVDGVGVMLADGGGLRFVDAQPRSVVGLERLQEALGQGPCYDSLFRQAHSVKGEAASLGLSSIEGRAHAFEDDLEMLRGKAELSGNDFLPLVIIAILVMWTIAFGKRRSAAGVAEAAAAARDAPA